MKAGGPIEQESQIQVIVRVKPLEPGESPQNKCVSLTKHEHPILVLESQHKK